jgi:hypothetical protein
MAWKGLGMQRLFAGIVLGIVSCVSLAGWAQPVPPPAATPATHRSACALGASMAGKLARQPMSAERASQTCQSLMPTMGAADAAEFKRCCAARLQAGAGAPASR